jgi:hypothetical protein
MAPMATQEKTDGSVGRKSGRARSRDAGFSAHLIKPVSLQTLRDTIRSIAK